MPAYKVEICGVNTSTLPVLNENQKKELFTRIRQGDQQAREEYIRGNLRLVLSVIRRFSASNENVDDLFQIGCIGLIKSIDNFDPTMEVKFSTYAVPMIIGEIRRYLRDNNSLRVSRSLRDTAYKAIHARELMTKKTIGNPHWMKSPKKLIFPKRTSPMHWMPSKHRSVSMIPFIQTAVNHFTSWIRSATRKTKKIAGWKISHSAMQ